MANMTGAELGEKLLRSAQQMKRNAISLHALRMWN